MTLPANAVVATQEMDPTDLVDWTANLRGDSPMLETGEDLDTFDLDVTAEGVAVGLSVKTGIGYDPATNGDAITFWLEVDPAERSNPLFNGEGVTLGIEITVETDNVPARRRQRTIAVKVRHQ